MASITKYRSSWLRLHKAYEKRALKVFMKAFKVLGNSIPFNFLTEDNYELLIETTASREVITNSYFEVYTQIGKAYGKRVGSFINSRLKVFTFESFLNQFERSVFQWLFTNGGARITLVRDTYIVYINNIIATGLADGKTIQEISRELEILVNRRNFYRWQAMRIARTETTTASNFAATQSAEVSGFVMEKMWISAQDPRTRRPPDSHFNHFIMNGKKVAQRAFFNVSGEKMLFPGDPKASAGNVINCRCTVAMIPKRDIEGNLVRV